LLFKCSNRYADRAKQIVCKAIVNEDPNAKVLSNNLQITKYMCTSWTSPKFHMPLLGSISLIPERIKSIYNNVLNQESEHRPQAYQIFLVWMVFIIEQDNKACSQVLKSTNQSRPRENNFLLMLIFILHESVLKAPPPILPGLERLG